MKVCCWSFPFIKIYTQNSSKDYKNILLTQYKKKNLCTKCIHKAVLVFSANKLKSIVLKSISKSLQTQY